MIAQAAQRRNWLNAMLTEMRQRVTERLAAPSAGVPLQRANLAQLAQAADELPLFVANCPVAQRYLELLGPLDWEHFPERDPHRPWPGSKPAPRAPYVAAYLVKLDQDKRTMSGLRSYLVEHPALVWVLGFALVPSATAPWGFDVEASVPSRRQLGRVLRQLPNACLQFLLTGLVTALQQELPAEMMFGDAIALDTKHILAWVRENNPKDYVAERHNPAKQPKGDRDCKLGCKRKRNRSAAEGDGSESGGAAPSATAAAAPVAAGSVAPSTTAAAAPVAAGSVAPSATAAASPAAAGSVAPTTPASEPVPASKAAVGEYYWGYASGVAATKVEGWGEFVLGEAAALWGVGHGVRRALRLRLFRPSGRLCGRAVVGTRRQRPAVRCCGTAAVCGGLGDAAQGQVQLPHEPCRAPAGPVRLSVALSKQERRGVSGGRCALGQGRLCRDDAHGCGCSHPLPVGPCERGVPVALQAAHRRRTDQQPGVGVGDRAAQAAQRCGDRQPEHPDLRADQPARPASSARTQG